MKNLILIVGSASLIIGGVFYFWWSRTNSGGTLAPFFTSVNSAIQEDDIPLVSIVTENLSVPWGVVFLPDGRMLVTEKKGTIQIIGSDGKVKPDPAATIKVNVKLGGEGGLMGITLDPNFKQNNYVYFYYTYLSEGNDTFNRVVRMKFENDKLSDDQIIVDQIPGALFHNGGRIKFGPDGYLYITTGDAQNSSQAQDTNSLAGKILKVTTEGKTAPGNPFNNLVYSYGHRNPQGIAWRSDGKLWATEHGRSNPTGFDEINLIQSGRNYGWEIIQGDETKEDLETPKMNSGATMTWAPAGAVFVGNSLFFAGLRGATLYQAVIEGDKVVELKKHLVGDYGRLREVILGSDGMLYITTSNKDGRGLPNFGDDKIIRVNPKKL